ncbi:MAG: DndE family protein [Flavobacteriaceae bacterium]|nr:DndE family protein [Flavobacteriaceae bacterium]
MIVKTSKENREIVSKLTRKLNLGSENHISRIAFAYSISQEKKLSLNDLKNSQGKEYSKVVFFGLNYELYVGLICMKYKLHSSDVDIPKYIKLHVDDGLNLLHTIIDENGYSTIIDLIPNLSN